MMRWIKLEIALLAVCVFQFTTQNVEVDDEENEIEEGDFGGLLQSFLESEGGKHIGEALLSMGASRNANQILDGIGAVLGSGGETGSMDASFLKTAFYTLTAQPGAVKGESVIGNLISWFIEIFGKEGGLENLMNFLPMMFSAINGFVEAEGQKGENAGHDWILPAVIEKVQEGVKHFTNSDVGSMVKAFVKETPFVKSFTTENGELDFVKLGESLENHSFRKHWIEFFASQITPILTRVFDPSFRSLIITTLEGQLNGMLKSKGYPKKTMFSSKDPIDSISAIINYSIEESSGYKFRSKQYVKPVYEYVKHVYNNVMYKGYFGGKKLKEEELLRQVTDIINLELIEPVVRVYRAYRFARSNKKCDKYVMCLVNQEIPDETVNLPNVRWFLYKASSLAASWSISGSTGTSFWTLYSNVMDNKQCEDVFHKSCEDFHAEEVKVKKQYVHSEL